MIGSHRENALFSRAAWRTWVVVPCWAVQVIILMSLMGLFSYRLSYTVETWEEEANKGTLPVVEFVWEIANIGFSLVSLVVVMVSIARFIAEVLTPVPLLFGCILNLVLSGAVLALDIVIYIQRRDRNYSIVGLALDATLMVFTIIPLIYAIVIYRRLLAYDDYHIPGNHKAFGFASNEDVAPDQSSLRRQSGPPQSEHTTSSIPTSATVVDEPQTHERSVSIGSHRVSVSWSTSSARSSVSSHPVEPVQERRASYDHRRDTQFEEYVARKISQDRTKYRDSLPSQGEVKKAMSEEFGFNRLPTVADAGRPNAKGEIVSAGAVHVAHASRPRASSIGRQTSFEAHITGQSGAGPVSTTPPNENVQLGHSLKSVPEAHEEEDYSGQGNRRTVNPVEVKQPLLGNRNSWSQAAGRGMASRSRSGSGNLPQIQRTDGFIDIELGGSRRR